MANLILWNDSKPKSDILSFIERITTKSSPDFVPVADRIAVFDNDGTLWCEKPLPVQADFIFRRLGEMTEKDSSLVKLQPWKAISKKDHKWLGDVITKHYQGDDSDLKQMSAGILKAFQNITVEEYAEKAKEFFQHSTHPVYHRPYNECAYPAMIELLDFLESHGFTNFIVSGGGRDFVRVISEKTYGIPPERIIGSSVALKFEEKNGTGDIIHIPALDVFDDGAAKPVHIWNRIGKRPILSVGNANGDIPMLKFCQHPRYPSLIMIVDHDDESREFKYNLQSDLLLEDAKRFSWTKISMKEDWKRIFSETSEVAQEFIH